MVEHTCAWCDEESPNAKRCAGCRKVWYCSKTCQTDHWPRHIFNCKSGQPISTAYYLSSSVWGDEIPVDAQTRIDYGFDKAEKLLNGESGSMLLGLYKGLFYAGVKEKELRLWQREGRLIEGIKATFEALPPRTRGGYYPWFLQHQYLLDGSPPDEDDVTRKTKDRALSMLRNGWIATGGSPHDSTEEIEAKLAALSEERRACHHFYTMLFSQAHPSPDLLAWLHFGFVASSSMGEEMHIARLYIALLNRCTFEEFCVAYETSSISALFDRYDIPLGNSPQFRDVMSGTPHVNKSVWDLKQYVDQLIALQPDAEGLPPLTPSVLCDYGFSNCKSPAERKMLDEMYTQLFAKPGMDPLALHEACIKGQLFDFVKSLIKLGGRSTAVKYARLLRNPYPLPDMEGLSLRVAR